MSDVIALLVIVAVGCGLVAIQSAVRWVLDREYWMGYDDGHTDAVEVREGADG